MDVILFGILIFVYIFTVYGLNEATYSNSDLLILFGAFVQMLICVEIVTQFPWGLRPIILVPLVFLGEYPIFHAIKGYRIFPVKLGIKLRSSLDDEL